MPKIVDHDERRAHIVDSLYALLAREGFSTLTMRRIAQEAGYAHGAIARYFPDKQAILKQTFNEMIERWHVRFNASTQGLTGLDGLAAFCHQLWPIGEEGRGNANVVVALWNEVVTDHELQTIQHRNNARLREMIHHYLQQAHENQEIDTGLDIEELERSILAQSMGWTMLVVLKPQVATDEILKADINLLISQLRQTADLAVK